MTSCSQNRHATKLRYISIILGQFSFQTPTPNFYKILIVLQKKNLSFKALEF